MNPYIEQKILSADPVELIRIVFEHGLLSVREAREHLRAGRAEAQAKSLARAMGVLAELMRALRPEAAPEIAGRLQNLYMYMQYRLAETTLEITTRDGADQRLTEVLGLMTTLSEAWTPQPEPQPFAKSGLAWQAATATVASSSIEIRG